MKSFLLSLLCVFGMAVMASRASACPPVQIGGDPVQVSGLGFVQGYGGQVQQLSGVQTFFVPAPVTTFQFVAARAGCASAQAIAPRRQTIRQTTRIRNH